MLLTKYFAGLSEPYAANGRCDRQLVIIEKMIEGFRDYQRIEVEVSDGRELQTTSFLSLIALPIACFTGGLGSRAAFAQTSSHGR